jgi:hypothetical protein
MIKELELVEKSHGEAINELVEKYEDSLKAMKEEIKNTVEKLKENGEYFEAVIEE